MLMALTESNGMLVPQCCQSERQFLPRAESAICCISTETALYPWVTSKCGVWDEAS